MRPLRNLLNELVERRLWPVALVLLLGLVAVPLLLAKPASAPDDGAPAVTSPAQAPAAAAAAARAPGDTPPGGDPVVNVAQADEPNAPLRGHAKNPFRQQHLEAAPSSASTASSAGTTTPPSAGTGAPGSTGGSVQTPPPSSQPPVKKLYWYPSIDVRFGHAGRKLELIEDLPALAALPRAQKPVVIFLGVSRRDPELAGFLISSDVHVQGTYARACYPDRNPCLVITMRRGDVVFFDYREADGAVVQYELDLVDLMRRYTDSPARANAAYAHSSRRGRRALRRAAHRARTAQRGRAASALHAQAVTGTTPGPASLRSLP
jgi:hypothetical protein